jgi:integrase
MSVAIRLFDPEVEAEPSSEETVASIIRQYLAEKQLLVTADKEERFRKDFAYGASFTAMHGSLTIDQCRNSNLTAWLTANPGWVSPHTKADAVGVVIRAFRWAVEEHLIRFLPYHRPRKLWPTPQPRKPIEPAEFRALMNVAREHNGRRGQPSRKKPVKTDLFDWIDRQEEECRLELLRKGADLFDLCEPYVPSTPVPSRPRPRARPSAGPFRRALWFLWESGCRTCEMREMEWESVDWVDGVIRLTKHKTAHTGNVREIPLTDRALRLLRLMYKFRRPAAASKHPRTKRHPAKNVIFLNSRGGAWTKRSFAKKFREFAGLAGIRDNITAYCLRHGFTVEALERGIGNKQIADMLGQASTRYVDWYGRGSREKSAYLRDNAAKVHRRKK